MLGIAWRRQLQGVLKCGLGLIEVALIELRAANDGPGDALLRQIHLGIARQQRLAELDRAGQIVRRVGILGRARQHAGALRVVGKGLRKAHGCFFRARVHVGACRRRQLLFLLLQSHQGSVAGRGGTRARG